MADNDTPLKNFPFEHDGETLWYSRAAVVGLFVFCKGADGEWMVLANQRGNGCPSNILRWNAPGGYVDHHETIAEAAARECMEETGVCVPVGLVKPFWINSVPDDRKENVRFRFYAILPGTTADYPTSDQWSEPDEVVDIRWIHVSNIWQYNWAFRHFELISRVYLEYVNPPFWKRVRNWLVGKLGGVVMELS